jgi:hypothetical protein
MLKFFFFTVKNVENLENVILYIRKGRMVIEEMVISSWFKYLNRKKITASFVCPDHDLHGS